MREYLLDKKEEIKELEVKERLIEFPILKNFIISVIGPRRAGKTYSIFNLIKTKNLRDEDFLFINFEDEYVKAMERGKLIKVISYHHELYGKEPRFVFLDEIQAFENWKTFVYTLFEKKRYFIFITGSSSRLLSREIATQLRGRSISVLVLPLSFKEIIALKEIDTDKISSRTESKIKNLLRIYLKDGGFPDVVLTEINKKIFFRDYLDLVVFRDVVERFRIKHPYLVKMIITFMLPSFAKEFSINRIFNILKSRDIKVSKKVLYKYSYALQDSMFCFFLKKFSFSERESLLSIPKIYLNDLGLINYSISTRFEKDLGRLMENAVFLELKRKESKGEISSIFYWRDYQQREVDFVIKEGLNVKQLIQVCYSLEDFDTRKREIKALLKASRDLKCKDLLVLTWDEEYTIEEKGKKIKVLPLWKWLI
ncbi:MAG: AAA family ATPase [Candidatus Altiarchaeales archaeon]|nr:MAG: AAA family ATPase [Candidatus Altiarchaeales archaeon]